LADIFREVDDELRRDSAQQLWDKYGIYVIGIAVSIVAVTSAVVGWNAYQTAQAEDAAVAFLTANVEASQEDADAAAIYAEFAENAPAGYAALARLREAAGLTTAGEIEAAIAAYENVAGDSGTEDILRDLASVKAGALLVGRTSYDDLAGRLLSLTGEGEAWRNPAREVLGLAAYHEQKYRPARIFFQEIVDDPTSTPGVRDRAHVMIALIDPHVPAVTPASNAEIPEDNASTDNAPVAQATPIDETAPRAETSEEAE